MRFIAQLLYMLAALLAFVMFSNGEFIGGFIIAAVFAMIGGFFQSRSEKAAEKERTTRATQKTDAIIAAAKQNKLDQDSYDTALYFRPFETTGKFVYDQVRSVTDGSQLFIPPQKDLERLLAEMVEQWMPLLCLGEPGEHIGSDRVKIDEEDWKEVVRRLSVACKLIFVLPGKNKGTIWEIRMLKELNLLYKTVFIVPQYSIDYGGGILLEWEETRTAVHQATGLELPTYRGSGQWCSFRPAGEMRMVEDNVTFKALQNVHSIPASIKELKSQLQDIGLSIDGMVVEKEQSSSDVEKKDIRRTHRSYSYTVVFIVIFMIIVLLGFLISIA